ncbi:WSC-domain protein [Chiua virens]|nr:WSC-domain protein [Chiua virens]
MAAFRLLTLYSALILQTSAFSPNVRHHAHRRALPAGWTAYGCWTDDVGDRTLSSASYANATGMTVESCISFCSTGSNAYIYAGVEYADECYCGNSFTAGATNVSSTDCDMTCAGDSTEYCGASDRLNVYWSGANPPPPPITVPSVGSWVSLGCYNDSVADRALSYGAAVSNVTVESCTAACQNAGYTFAGMEYADQCYCGSILDYGSAPTPLTECDMTCDGNSSEYCGGPDRLNLYNYTGTTTSSGGGGGGILVGGGTDTSETWTYAACYVDNAYGRILGNENDNSNTTVESCIAYCSTNNFTLAGIEYSTQCFCGDYLVNGAVQAPESDCDMACGGNAT